MIGQAWRDLRHSARMLTRMPGLSAVVVCSLGVGIGANTVVFSWFQAVVFNPVAGVTLPSGFEAIEPRNESGMYPGSSWREYLDLREQLHALDRLIAFRMAPLYIGEAGQVEKSTGLLVSDNYFTALGLRPAAGRFFRPDEVVAAGAAPVVVISYDYWRTRLGGGAAVGQRIRINGADLTIVGVAPRGFQGTIMRLSFDLWIPATMGPALFGSNDLEDRASRGFTVTGILTPGTSQAQAQTDVDTAMRRLEQAYPRTNRGTGADVLPFWKSPRGPQRLLAASLGVLQGVMMLLLLAVCGNTANLLLARASARHREIGVRLALGAGRWRIVSLLLAETLLLALMGAALGAAIAFWGTTTLNAVPPMRVRGIPISFETSLNLVSLGFTAALGVVCGLIFGLAPALQLARIDPQQSLRAGANTPPRSRLRNTLMAVEVALAIVVLVSGGLFLRSFLATQREDPGFRREGVLLAAYDFSGRRVGEPALRAFTANLLDRVRALPGVESAALATSVPLDIHGLPIRFFTLEGRARADQMLDQALTNSVSPGYFDVMGVPLVAGHDFADLRDAAAAPETIVNQAFVRRFLDGADPLGRQVEVRSRRYAIVGVVRDSVSNAFGEPPTPILYFSIRDRAPMTAEMHLRVRPGAETTLAADLRRVVRDLDPELPVYDVRTLSDHIESNLIFRRIPARMFAVLGPLMLLLAAIGIYAVVAYAVTLQTNEIGVRLALGATAPRLIARVVGEHLVVIAAGSLLGWCAAFAVVVGMMGLPFEVSVFAGVPFVLMAVATLAAWWPARRVALVDPIRALRSE